MFDATHRRVLQWLRDGQVHGLRIDHPDGLADPRAYLERLQRAHARAQRERGETPRALYLVVEKIGEARRQIDRDHPCPRHRG